MLISPRLCTPAVRPGHRLPALLLTSLALFGLAPSGFAATLSVTSAGDSGPGSLRSAIAAAAAGDTITFDSGAFPASGSAAIALTSGRLVVSKNLTIRGPGARAVTISDSGDGVFIVSGSNTATITVQMSGLTLANSNATSATSNGNGGGIYAFDANMTVTSCTFSGNSANGGGGAVSNNGGTLSFTGCTFNGNTASVGGAVSNNSGGTVSLTNCTLFGNATSVGGHGGGVSSSGTQLTLTNCTLLNNTAASNQSASGQGGGLYNSGAATVASCILNGNNAVGGGPDVFGTVTSGGSNIVGDPNGAAYGFTAAHDQVYVNPKLDPNGLTSNNGPTPTVAVLAGSPAIGADFNNATATDQRGFYRTGAQHTIGAYEYKTSHTHLLWNNPDGRVILWNVAQDGSFTYHIFGPYSDGAPNTPWYAAALATGPDGLSHILWTNPDGRVILWTVSDSGSFTYALYGPYTDGSASTPWSATALSVGPDNMTHILWNNPDHRVFLWNVDSAFNFTNHLYGPYTDGSAGTPWMATALATGPDNFSRIVWNNPSGRVFLWNVDRAFNFTDRSYGPYTDGSASTPWSAKALSVGPDNMTHILWNNPDTRVFLWNVDSAFNFTNALYGPYTDGSASTPWSADALATGGDGFSHILWNNPDTRVFLWNVDSAFNFTNTLYGPYTDGSASTPWKPTAISTGP